MDGIKNSADIFALNLGKIKIQFAFVRLMVVHGQE
jgi:hypothetical protein